MKKKIIVRTGAAAGILVLFVCIYVYAVHKPVSYQTVKAEKGDISGCIEESGDIQGNEEIVYYAGVTAPVSEVMINTGDEVSADEILLEYDTSDLKRSLSEAAISFEQAEKSADGQIESSSRYESKYNKASADDAAYAGLYAWQRESSQSMDEAQYSENWNIQCQTDSINKQIAEKNSEITEITQKYNDMTDKNTDEAKKIKQDIENLNNDVSGLREELAGAAPQQYTPSEYAAANDKSNVLEDIARNWNQAKSDKASAETGILNSDQKAALKKNAELTAQYKDAAEDELHKAEGGVKAEFDGIVTDCSIKKGEMAAEGTQLFTLESSRDLKVTVMISKYDIGLIKEGQKADIDMAGNIYKGTVSRIERVAVTDEADKNKVAVDIHFDSPDGRAIIGLEADVTIYTDERKNVLLIPYSAYYTDDNGDFCYVIDNGKVNKKYIKAGIVTDDLVEVKEGITEGETVITDAVTDSAVGNTARASQEKKVSAE